MSETGELPLEEPAKGKKTVQEFKTGEVMNLIQTKWGDRGEHIVLFDCPNVVGMKQTRRCDAVCIGMWQRAGYLMHGMEIKVSRSDWLRELKDTSKADPFLPNVDRWWLVTGNINVAKPEEIPDYWGWANATPNGLRILRPPKPIESTHGHDLMLRSWAYALIQRARMGASEEEGAIIRARVAEAEREAVERLEREYASRNRDHYQSSYEKLKATVDAAEAASGLPLSSWRFGDPAAVGRLAAALHQLNGYSGSKAQLKRHIADYMDLAKRTREVLDVLEEIKLGDGE